MDDAPLATTDPYWELLRIGNPWELRAMQRNREHGSLEFLVAWKASTPLRCPECGQTCPRYDDEPERKWRHRRGVRLLLLITASVPRCHCPEHGIKTIQAPWLAPGTWFVEYDGINSEERHSSRLNFKSNLAHYLRSVATRKLRPRADQFRATRVARALRKVNRPFAASSLPFDHDPPYKAYQCLGAHPLGMLSAVTDLTPLLASEYINLSCLNTPDSFGELGAVIVPNRPIGRFVVSGHCECFTSKPPLSGISRAAALVHWMIDRILEGWYVFLHVNNYYMPDTWAYSNTDLPHDCLITGFDTERKVFRVAMYLANGAYDVVTVPFTSVVMAMMIRGSQHLAADFDCYHPMALAVRPKPDVKFEFNRESARKNLMDYLQSAPPDDVTYARDDLVYAGDWVLAMGYPRGSHSYGLEAVSALVAHMRSAIMKRDKVATIDTRVLWEHRKIMRSNIEFWARQSFLPQAVESFTKGYLDVVRWAHTLHLNCFAYNMERLNSREFIHHLDQYEATVEIEKKVLTQILISWGSAFSQTRVNMHH